MLKKIAALGLSAALALSPLAALAQTDQSAAPGAAAGENTMPAKPMKSKHHSKKHMSKKSKSMAPAEPAAPAAPAEAPKS